MLEDKYALNEQTLNSNWFKAIDELTINDAAFLMVIGTDPEVHELRCDADPVYQQNYFDHPYGEAYVLQACAYIQSAAHEGLIKLNRGADKNSEHLDINTTYISKISWLAWCLGKGYIAHSYLTSESKVAQEDENKWDVYDSRDPIPAQPWYTPARYFARQLVKGDPTLLTKRAKLATKVVQSLSGVGFYKRGGKLPLDSGTVLKAFSNVKLG
jgi:hypothetical protein